MESAGSKPLAGIRIAALATNVPGPVAAAALAAMGAEVVKIEPPQGDPLEAAAPRWYRQLTAHVRVERVDLRCAQARLLAEVARADLLLTTMRPKALSASGLDWPKLHGAFPRVCHVAIFGEAPPDSDRAGHDLTYQARAGMLAPPALPRALLADMFAAERAVTVSLAALLHRERTGEAARHDVAIAQGAIALADALRYGLTAKNGPLGGALPYYALYRTADGWIALAALEPHFQTRLRDALGVDPNDREALEARFGEHSSSYWEEVAQVHDLPLASLASV